MYIRREMLSGLAPKERQFNNAVVILEKVLSHVPSYTVTIATVAELNHGRRTFGPPDDQTICVLFYGKDHAVYAIWQSPDEVFHLRQIKPRNGNPEDVGYYIVNDCRDSEKFSDIMKYLIGHKIF